jgi:hypothetical protein
METGIMIGDKLVLERVEKRLNGIRRLFVHLILTVVIALGLTWAVDQLGVPRKAEDIIPLAVLLFIAHALWVMYTEMRYRIVQEELSRAQESDANLDDKPKRGGSFALDDDGELVELIYEEDSEGEQAAKRGH